MQHRERQTKRMRMNRATRCVPRMYALIHTTGVAGCTLDTLIEQISAESHPLSECSFGCIMSSLYRLLNEARIVRVIQWEVCTYVAEEVSDTYTGEAASGSDTMRRLTCAM